MSVTEAPPRCGLRALTDLVSEQLTRVGEEILAALDKRRGGFGSSRAPGRLLRLLRRLLTERLAAAAQRIVGLLQREVEEDRRRQDRLLEAMLSPVVRLNRTDSVSSSVVRTAAAARDRPPLSDLAHLPSAAPSPAPSDDTAAESDDDSSIDKDTEGTGGGRRPGGRRRWAESTGRPANQRCVVCGKTFCHIGNLLRHAGTHSHDPRRLCGVCGRRLESAVGLSDHLRSHRDGVGGGGACEVCGKTFQNMETHMRSHTGVKPFSCNLCGKRFPRPGALRRHKEIHRRREEGHRREEDSRGFLRKHAETQSRPSRSVCGRLRSHPQSHRDASGTCGVCGKTFQNLEEHMRSHTGVKPFCCAVCSKRFPRPGALRRHRKIHSGERPHVCQRCGKTFIESGALKTHSRNHWEVQEVQEVQEIQEMQEVQELQEVQEIQEVQEVQEIQEVQELQEVQEIQEVQEVQEIQEVQEMQEGGYIKSAAEQNLKSEARPATPPRCKVCGEYFQNKSGLRKHSSVCGETLTNQQDAGNICHICGKTFQNMETHMRSHTGVKPYRCSVCDKSFPRPGALRRHQKIHSGERPYICEFCGKTFIDNGALTTHIRNHTGLKPAARVSCDTCGKSLASVHVLEVHRRIHTGEKPFRCRVCGKAFRQAGGLNAHTLTHTGEKPFSCSLCGKSFSTKGYLETHLRFHRREKPFGCPLCWKAFVTKNDLKKHLLTHSGEKPYGCRVCGRSYQEKRSRDVHMKLHQDRAQDAGHEPIRAQDAGHEPIRAQDGPRPDFLQL